MKLWIAASSLALLAACSSSDSTSAPPIEGKLVVHTGYQVEDGGGVSVRVLLGDGTKFNQPVDANGDVTFQDSALQGPQTVTIVTAGGEPTTAETLVGINSAELWLPGTVDGAPAGIVGHASGTVTGIADAGDLTGVTLVGKAFGFGAANGGAFSFPEYGTDGGFSGSTGFLLGLEQTPGDYRPVKAGMIPNVPLGGELTGQELVLDHPFDQSFSVTVPNAATYGGEVNAELFYFLGTRSLFSTQNVGASPVTLTAIAHTAPFDATTLAARVNVGNRNALPNGKVEAQAAASGTSASITLPAPLTISSPALGPEGSPVTVSAAGLKLAWKADPAAQAVSIELYEDTLDWLVLAPAGVNEFSFFPLPSNASPVPGLTGATTLTANELRQDGFGGFEDYFLADTTERSDQAINYWETALRGDLTLQ